ncbi:MAG TPA: hypothetical protein DEP72_02520 [Clostridiales bacterium]|nr:MAG: hypothetical protein A2Y18_06080 [Clostridiales bacterium GWD2_32_19]HCC07030.1 hypothetical protein [Clostridiales bacterium]
MKKISNILKNINTKYASSFILYYILTAFLLMVIGSALHGIIFEFRINGIENDGILLNVINVTGILLAFALALRITDKTFFENEETTEKEKENLHDFRLKLIVTIFIGVGLQQFIELNWLIAKDQKIDSILGKSVAQYNELYIFSTFFIKQVVIGIGYFVIYKFIKIGVRKGKVRKILILPVINFLILAALNLIDSQYPIYLGYFSEVRTYYIFLIIAVGIIYSVTTIKDNYEITDMKNRYKEFLNSYTKGILMMLVPLVAMGIIMLPFYKNEDILSWLVITFVYEAIIYSAYALLLKIYKSMLSRLIGVFAYGIVLTVIFTIIFGTPEQSPMIQLSNIGDTELSWCIVYYIIIIFNSIIASILYAKSKWIDKNKIARMAIWILKIINILALATMGTIALAYGFNYNNVVMMIITGIVLVIVIGLLVEMTDRKTIKIFNKSINNI